MTISRGKSLFDRLGGRATLAKVHKIFYDKLYAHPWLKNYFSGIDQNHIETQQTDFIAQLIGGPRGYGGRMPADAHTHIFINEELFILRQALLADSLTEANIPQTERDEWLRVDAAFKRVLVKTRVSKCQKRFFTDQILDFPNPAQKKAS